MFVVLFLLLLIYQESITTHFLRFECMFEWLIQWESLTCVSVSLAWIQVCAFPSEVLKLYLEINSIKINSCFSSHRTQNNWTCQYSISAHRTSVKSPITSKGLNPMDTPIPVPFDLLVLDTVYPPFPSSFDFQTHVLLIFFLYLAPNTS